MGPFLISERTAVHSSRGFDTAQLYEQFRFSQLASTAQLDAGRTRTTDRHMTVWRRCFRRRIISRHRLGSCSGATKGLDEGHDAIKSRLPRRKYRRQFVHVTCLTDPSPKELLHEALFSRLRRQHTTYIHLTPPPLSVDEFLVLMRATRMRVFTHIPDAAYPRASTQSGALRQKCVGLTCRFPRLIMVLEAENYTARRMVKNGAVYRRRRRRQESQE